MESLIEREYLERGPTQQLLRLQLPGIGGGRRRRKEEREEVVVVVEWCDGRQASPQLLL